MRLQSHHPLYSAPLLLLASSTFAQEDSGNDLIGCVDLECPSASGSSLANNCTVGDTSFQAIGVAPEAFSVSLSGNDGDSSFSWTVGSSNPMPFTNNPQNDSEILVEQHFFVGTPADLDLSQSPSDLGAQICAFFFSQSDNKTLGWKDEWLGATDGSAECGSYIGDSCTNDIISTATKKAKTGDTTNCTAIAEEVKSSLSDICPDMGRKGVEDIKISAMQLTGEQSDLSPLSGADNSSSNCHPTMPRSNALTPVRDVTIAQPKVKSSRLDVLESYAGGFTPVLTVVVPESKGSENNDSSAFMTCVRPFTMSKEGLEDQEEDAGMTVAPNWGILSVLLAVAGAVALQL